MYNVAIKKFVTVLTKGNLEMLKMIDSITDNNSYDSWGDLVDEIESEDIKMDTIKFLYQFFGYDTIDLYRNGYYEQDIEFISNLVNNIGNYGGYSCDYGTFFLEGDGYLDLYKIK